MSESGGIETASETILLLETRLQRIEFFVNGQDGFRTPGGELSSQAKHDTIQPRLQRIEVALQKLASQSRVIEAILNLHRNHADIFPAISAADDEKMSSITEQLAIVDSCATLFPTTASRLTSLQDMPIPSAESSANLVSLLPRLAKIALLQESYSMELANLRDRTASVLQRWYEIGVLGQGECWTEWEGRLMEAEKALRRQEALQAREAGIL